MTGTGPETAPAGLPEVTFGVDLSRGFTEWLATKRISLAMTPCQVGRLILSGLDKEGQMWRCQPQYPLLPRPVVSMVTVSGSQAMCN